MRGLKAAYYAFALGAMMLFTPACILAGDGNLPPQKPLARLVINTIFLHAIAVYVWLFSDKGLRIERRHWALFTWVGLLFCAMPPVFSGDLHDYLMYGRIFGVYHDNPYVIPRFYPDDPFYSLSVWVGQNKVPQNYGPVWTLVQWIAPTLFRDSYVLSLFFFKLMLFGFLACSAWLFRKIALRMDPQKAEWLTALFVLNPNLVSQTLIDGHNDILMVLLMLAAFYFMVKQNDLASVVFASLSVLVKFTSVVVLPAVVVYALGSGRYASPPRKLFHLTRSALLFAAICAAFYAPFWEGKPLAYFSTFGTWFASNSVPYAVQAALARIGIGIPSVAVQHFFSMFFAANVFAALAWLALRPRAEPRHAALALSWMFLAMVGSYTIPFYGHHLLWAFAFLLLADLPAPLVWVALYTASGVFFYFKRLSVLFVLSIAAYLGCLAGGRRPRA